MQDIQIIHYHYKDPGFVCDGCYKSPKNNFLNYLEVKVKNKGDGLSLCSPCYQIKINQLTQQLLGMQEKMEQHNSQTTNFLNRRK